MKKVLSVLSPNFRVSPRDELRFVLDETAKDFFSDITVQKSSWTFVKASVHNFSEMSFFRKDYKQQDAINFEPQESRKLLTYLQDPSAFKNSLRTLGTSQELANQVDSLRLKSPDDPTCDALLRSVLTTIVTQVSGKVVQSNRISTFFNDSSTEASRGIKEVLLSETLKEVFLQFGERSCEAILDVLEITGKNKHDLMALYVEVKLHAATRVLGGYTTLLNDIKQCVQDFPTLEPSPLGYVRSAQLFEQLDTVLEKYSEQLTCLEPNILKELITSISHAFLVRYEEAFNSFGLQNCEQYTGLSPDETHLMFLNRSEKIDQPLDGYFRAARIVDGMYSFERDTASQKGSLKEALMLVLSLHNGKTKRRNLLLYQNREQMISYGLACSRAVCEVIETTGKNKTILVPMYIEARLKAPQVQKAYDARQKARWEKIEKEKQEGIERRRQEEAKEQALRLALRAEEQNQRDIQFASLLRVPEIKELKPEIQVDYASKLPSQDNSAYESLEKNFLNEYVRRCGEGESSLTQANLPNVLSVIWKELLNLSSLELTVFLTPKERKNSLNSFLLSQSLNQDRIGRHLVKQAVAVLYDQRRASEYNLKEVVREIVNDILIKETCFIKIDLNLEGALKAILKQDILNHENPHFVKTCIGDVLGRDRFELVIGNNKIRSSKDVCFVYGQLDQNNQTEKQYDNQEKSNNVLIGFILNTLGLDHTPYYREQVKNEMNVILKTLKGTGAKK